MKLSVHSFRTSLYTRLQPYGYISRYPCENYEVERQRHSKQVNYTQDSSFIQGKRRAALGGIPTHDTPQSELTLQLSCVLPNVLGQWQKRTEFEGEVVEDRFLHCLHTVESNPVSSPAHMLHELSQSLSIGQTGREHLIVVRT